LKTTTSKTVLGGVSMAVAMALLLAALALSPGDAGAADEGVSMTSGLAFVPGTVNINVGDTVTWTNTSAGIPHTTTSNTGVWDSGNLTTNQTFAFTFTAPGTYPYFCEVHGAGVMSGTVIVGQQQTPTTTTATATTTTATATTTTATATTTTATASPTTPTATATTPTATATTPTATATTTTTAVAPATTVAPGPPATGTGTDSGTNDALLILAAGLAMLGLSGGAFLAVRWNS
jgi:plastocyanin